MMCVHLAEFASQSSSPSFTEHFELILFAFGVLTTIGVAVTLFIVFSRDDREPVDRDDE